MIEFSREMMFLPLFLLLASCRTKKNRSKNSDSFEGLLNLLNKGETGKFEDSLNNLKKQNQKTKHLEQNSMKGRKIKSIKNDDPPSDAAAIPSSPSPSKKNVKPKMSQTPQPILNEKEDKMFDNAQKSLEELRKIKFYLQLLTDKFVPQEIQEQALKARLDAAKARISQVPELPTTANVTTSTSVPNV